MKKALSIAVSAGLAMTFAATTPLQAQGRSDEQKSTTEYCKTFFGGGGNGPNQGRCIAFFNTEDPVSTCAELKAFGRLEEFGFRNQGECIKALSED